MVYRREIPLYTLEGVADATHSHHQFSTTDGLGLTLERFQRRYDDTADSVMIVHGLTTSTDMFVMPEHENLVSYLLGQGFGDVWTLDMRMSNRHSYNLFPHRYTMDDVALYDYPPAIDLIRSYYHEGITQDEIALKLGVTQEYLSTSFHKSMGVSFSHYLRDLRIQKAKEMLIGTNLKQWEIATRIGYTDAKYFGKVFKECTGMLPTDYRRRNQ